MRIEELEEIKEIDLGRWRVQEVKNTLKMMWAAQIDKVGQDLLRADMEDTTSRLTRCYNKL